MPHPAALFQGTLVLAAPHMDDCVLACGGLLALLPDQQRVHVIYATDGRGSPAPAGRRPATEAGALSRARMAEARAALASLGVPPGQVHFLGLPDGRLRRCQPALRAALSGHLQRLAPDYLLLPFRYDRHADHIALNHSLMAAHSHSAPTAQLLEYFVYYRWRLLPGGDVRRYIHAEHLIAVSIETAAVRKRAALACFHSQTTRYYGWQSQPVLSARLLDEVCGSPEVFLRTNTAPAGARVFTHAGAWLRLAHRLEPLLKRHKDRAAAAWHGLGSHGRPA